MAPRLTLSSNKANVASYVRTYCASGLDAVLYFSDDRDKMILINGHEAELCDISKNIKRQYKILRKKELERHNPIGLQNSRA